MQTRRAFTQSLGALAGIGLTARASAQLNRTTIILPYPAGGATDMLARMVAEKLQTRIGHPVIVDYKPGGNHAVANQYVRSQSPNGGTLYMVSTPFSAAPASNPSVHKFHPANDFSPVARLTTNVTILAAHAGLPASTLAEVIQYAKANPGKVQFATTGLGTRDHLIGYQLGKKAGVEFNFVHYTGSAQAFQDLMGGQVHLKVDSYASSKPALDSGRVKIVALADPQPSALLPQYQTLDATYPGLGIVSYFGLIGPPGMPADVTSRLSAQLREIIVLEELAPKLRQLAMDPAPMPPEEFGRFIAGSYEQIRSIIKEANIKLE